MKTVIMAGGRGTRIASVARDIPKPMLPIAGKPVLEWEIESLREQGFADIILTVGHLGSVIQDYFGDGSKFGVSISYYLEEKPLGNAGALYEIKNNLDGDFLLLNGDAIFDVDFGRLYEYHKRVGGLATILVHPNSHPYDGALIEVGENGRVDRWMTKEDDRPTWYINLVNAGVHVMSSKLLSDRPDTEKVDLDRQILKPLAGTGNLFAYESSEYIKDMGTPDRYKSVEEDFVSGLVQKKSYRNKQKAIFLDRDGTVNRYVGFLRNIDEMGLIDGVAEAIGRINRSGYLAVLVTNQPVIARGEVSEEELRQIHNKMETLLAEKGVYIDRLYYCPHHPDKGFEGERPEYKIECECRKPKPGMLYQAAADMNIDLSESWMIGDGKHDIGAGKAAGCKTILLVGEDSDTDVGADEKEFGQDFTCDSLAKAVDKVLG